VLVGEQRWRICGREAGRVRGVWDREGEKVRRSWGKRFQESSEGSEGAGTRHSVKEERWGISELEQGRTDHGVRSWSREERMMKQGVGEGKNG
jgi:hypothetical protein